MGRTPITRLERLMLRRSQTAIQDGGAAVNHEGPKSADVRMDTEAESQRYGN